MCLLSLHLNTGFGLITALVLDGNTIATKKKTGPAFEFELKREFLLNFASVFLLFLPFSAFCTQIMKKHISTSVWSAAPNAGQNIQHKSYKIVITLCFSSI